jgi:hypothetical protein
MWRTAHKGATKAAGAWHKVAISWSVYNAAALTVNVNLTFCPSAVSGRSGVPLVIATATAAEAANSPP